MFWGLMIHIITRVFKHLHSFTCSAKIMPTWTSTLNHLIAIIAFDSHFKSSSISLSLPILHLKKYIKKVLLHSPQIGEDSRVSYRTN